MKLCEESEPTKIPHFVVPKSSVWPGTALLIVLALVPTALFIYQGQEERAAAQLEDPSYVLADFQRVHYLRSLSEAPSERSRDLFLKELLLLSKTGVYRSPKEIDAALSIMSPELLAKPEKAPAEIFESLLRVTVEYQNDQALKLLLALHPKSPGALRAGLFKLKQRELRNQASMLLISQGLGERTDIAYILTSIELKSPAPDRNQRLRDLLSIGRQSQRTPPTALEKDALDAILRYGPKALPQVVKGLGSASPGRIGVSVQALQKLSPERLCKELELKLSELRQKEAFKDSAIKILKIFAAIKKAPRNDKRLVAAEKLLSEIHQLSKVLHEGLLAIKDNGNNPATQKLLLQGLALHNTKLSGLCEAALKEQWKAKELCSQLLSFLAGKKELRVQELKNYEAVLTRCGPEISSALTASLTELYQSAGKNPAKVSWTQKTVVLRCLAKIGQPDAFSIIQQFSRDPNGYSFTAKVKDEKGKEREEKTRVRFRDLCKEALDAIAKRTKKTPPHLLPEDASLLLPGTEKKQ